MMDVDGAADDGSDSASGSISISGNQSDGNPIHIPNANLESDKLMMEIAVGSLGPDTLTSDWAYSSYSSEEWELKRPIITQLYRDERKCVEEVKAVLAQQSSRPM